MFVPYNRLAIISLPNIHHIFCLSFFLDFFCVFYKIVLFLLLFRFFSSSHLLVFLPFLSSVIISEGSKRIYHPYVYYCRCLYVFVFFFFCLVFSILTPSSTISTAAQTLDLEFNPFKSSDSYIHGLYDIKLHHLL